MGRWLTSGALRRCTWQTVLVEDEAFAWRLALKCVRVLSCDAIVFVMLLQSKSRGVRQLECDLSARAPDESARLH
jgi:hypothetical protein